MSWQSPSEINASRGLDSFIPYLSTVTEYWFGRMLIFAVFLIFFFGYMRSKGGNFFSAFAVSSYVTFVISMLFWAIDMITGLDFAWVVGITLIASALLLVQNNKN
jgi:hypothetical protein